MIRYLLSGQVGLSALILSALCLLTACSGITPDGEMYNYREEGPKKGLFTGEKGEFVIVAPGATEEADKQAKETDTQ